MTRVSIITPSYKNTLADYSKTKRSIEAQTNTDLEWIVVDDGNKGPFRVPSEVRLENNYGPSVARNAGFQISSGDIIAYVDMGDELAPDRVESLVKLYDNYDVEISFCSYYIIDSRGSKLVNHFDYIGKMYSAYDYIKLLKNHNISTPLGVAHRRKPFVEVGGFQRGIVCGEDGVLWRRMIDKVHPTQIMFTDDIAGNYYVEENSQARTQRRFEMGGFALDGELMDNGRYLDNDWFKNFTSEGYYE